MNPRRLLLKVWKPLTVIGGVYVFCTAGFVLSERYGGHPISWFTGFYWGLTTLSTVGYGDVYPTNGYARIFAMVLMATTLGVIGYLVSTITLLAMQIREEEMLGVGGTKMTGHTLVLGWTPASKSALTELIYGGQRIALMTRKQENVVEIRTYVLNLISHSLKDPELKRRVSRHEDVFVGYGDYTEKSALSSLGLEAATKAIVASEDDAHNVMTSLILKEIAPHLRIVVALTREHFRETLESAGVTYVISPSEMGGRMLAGAAIQPEVALTIDNVTNSGKGATINEYEVVASSPLAGKSFDEATASLRRKAQALLIGLAKPRLGNSHVRFTVTMAPPPDTRVERGDYLIILASTLGEEDGVEKFLGVGPGRDRTANPQDRT